MPLVLLVVLVVVVLVVGGYASRRTIILRDSETCESPTALTISSLSADLSRFPPDTVVYFAVFYKQGRDRLSAGSISNVWLFQLLQRSGWDVDWFETDVDLKVHGFSIVVNDSTVLPPAGLKLAQILARHSIMIKWRQSPSMVSWTNDWCITSGVNGAKPPSWRKRSGLRIRRLGDDWLDRSRTTS